MLEYAVRPFGPPNAQGKTLLPATPANTRQRATLTWGASSTLPPPQYTNVKFACCTENNKELDRTGETVRITGNDGESFVDVFRANKLHLNKKSHAACDGGLGQGDVAPSMSFAPSLSFAASSFSSSAGNNDQNCDVTLVLNNNTTQIPAGPIG